MDKEADAKRILKGNPWIYRNSWLVLKEWDENVSSQEVEFLLVPIWIQIWGIPLAVRSKSIGMKIGSKLGKVEEYEVYQYPNNVTIVKVMAIIDTSKAIKPGFFMGSHMEQAN